jgi:hypothetical protein
MLTSVEGALAGIGLHPDSQVQCLAVDGTTGLEQFADVPPIHADEVNRSIDGNSGSCGKRFVEKRYKSGARKLAGSHREIAMFDLSPTDDIADPPIKRGVKESHRRAAAIHQVSEVAAVAGITT